MGRMFHEFRVVISVAIFDLGVRFAEPDAMMCSRFLQPPAAKHGVAYNAFERVFEGMRDAYKWSLNGRDPGMRADYGGGARRWWPLTTCLGSCAGVHSQPDTGQLNGSTRIF